MVWQDRQITTNNISDKLDICCGSAYFIIHEDLRYHKICPRWVHVEKCMQFLQQYREDVFLQCSHRSQNMGAPLWTYKQMSKHGVETHVIAQVQEKWMASPIPLASCDFLHVPNIGIPTYGPPDYILYAQFQGLMVDYISAPSQQ